MIMSVQDGDSSSAMTEVTVELQLSQGKKKMRNRHIAIKSNWLFCLL